MTETRMQSELADPKKFLYLNSLPKNQRDSMLVRLHSGEVVIEPMSTRDNGKEIQVIDGFVHHWLAIGFIPSTQTLLQKGHLFILRRLVASESPRLASILDGLRAPLT
jgi:hypothetical protein